MESVHPGGNPAPKSKTFLYLLGVVILLLGGSLFWFLNTEENCDVNLKPFHIYDEYCPVKKALQTQDPTHCSQVIQNSAFCVLNVALLTRDPDVCVTHSRFDLDKDFCVMAVAALNQSTDDCKKSSRSESCENIVSLCTGGDTSDRRYGEFCTAEGAQKKQHDRLFGCGDSDPEREQACLRYEDEMRELIQL